jgi:hypothetical protein
VAIRIKNTPVAFILSLGIPLLFVQMISSFFKRIRLWKTICDKGENHCNDLERKIYKMPGARLFLACYQLWQKKETFLESGLFNKIRKAGYQLLLHQFLEIEIGFSPLFHDLAGGFDLI